MPSKQRGEELRKIINSIRDGTFEYESKELLGYHGLRGTTLAQIRRFMNFVPKPPRPIH